MYSRSIYTLTLKYSLYRYFGPKVYTIWAHEPAGVPPLDSLVANLYAPRTREPEFFPVMEERPRLPIAAHAFPGRSPEHYDL